MDHDRENLPPQFWSSPLLSVALAEGDMLTILREVRHAQGWSQGELGEVLGYSQSWVSKVLRGSQALSLDQVRHIATRLGIPIHLFRVGHMGDDDQTRRRDFAKAVVLTTLGAGSAKRTEADENTAPTLISITGAQRRLESNTPARELTRAAVPHLEMARRILQGGRITIR